MTSITSHIFKSRGYYYRGDYPQLNDTDWHAFTASQYDAKTGEWQMSKLPVHQIIV